MNHIKMTIVLIAIVGLSVAQAPKKISPEKPNLSDSFTNACLKALLAIENFTGTGSLTGPAKDAHEAARIKANSASAPETSMFANLTNFAIMRSADNLARENIVQKAKAKIDRDPELSSALDSINEREAECSAALEKAFRNRIAIPLPGTCSGR
jgi:hypothetical protein